LEKIWMGTRANVLVKLVAVGITVLVKNELIFFGWDGCSSLSVCFMSSTIDMLWPVLWIWAHTALHNTEIK
jgi:hypothetical protein